jgi:hypothetical protein
MCKVHSKLKIFDMPWHTSCNTTYDTQTKQLSPWNIQTTCSTTYDTQTKQLAPWNIQTNFCVP